LLERFGGDKRPDPARCGSFPYSVTRRWYGFVSVGVSPGRLPDGCTSQGQRLTLDESIGIKNYWCNSTGNPAEFHGHLNWVPVTYQGKLRFSDYASDHDMDLDLFVGDSAGQTINNEYGRLHIEFDRRETTDHFTTPWWSRFNNSKSFARMSLNSDPIGSEAVIVGLLGLDAVHGAHAEMHPVYGLAIRTDSSERSDRWQVFARNSGNEGECAGNQHYLDLADSVLRMRIPLRDSDPASQSPEIDGSFFRESTPLKRNVDWWVVKSADRKSVVIAFRLPEPMLRAVFHGYVDLPR
jgi:hypothetical protein